MTDHKQVNLPDPPVQLKAIQSFMRIAKDIDRIDTVIAYWLRLYCTESALKIDKDSQESKTFLVTLLSWLEGFKQSHKDNEVVTNQTVGQAHFENFVMALFDKADALDRQGTADKNTVKMFYMASVMFEAMAVFGSLTDEVTQKAKYAKIKAAYIQRCLKAGQTPKPGPVEGADLDGSGASNTVGANSVESPPNSSLPSNTQSMSSSNGGGLYIPEVPKGSPDDSATAIVPPKSTDPFILTPSQPPSINKPLQPSTTPTSTMQRSEPNRSTIAEARFVATNGTPLKPEDILKGQKYCKFANSALQYDDIPTAVTNLQKALQLLTTGKNSD